MEDSTKVLGAVVVVQAVALVEAHGLKAEDKEWIPITKLGHLFKDLRINSLEIYLFSLTFNETEIIDVSSLGTSLKVLKIMPLRKQT